MKQIPDYWSKSERERKYEGSLIDLLKSGEMDAANAAAIAMAKIGSNASIDALLKKLSVPLNKYTCPPKVAYAVGELCDESVLEKLASKLMECYDAIEWVRKECSEHDRTPIEHEYRSNAYELGEEIVAAMKKINEEKSFKIFVGYLKKPKYERYAAQALQHFGDKSIPHLIKCLESKGFRTREYAVESLVELKAKEALPYLERIAARESGPYAYQSRSREAIERIKGKL